MTIIRGSRCLLRPYTESDVDALAAIANDKLVSQWMTHRFPYPYTRDDAVSWIGLVGGKQPMESAAIEVDGRLAGGIGLTPWRGNRTGVAEFGYWLGRPFWGKGIATEASSLFSEYAFSVHGLRRLEAHVLMPNVASARVLEKSGFDLEAVLRAGAVDREGAVVDLLLYAKIST